MSISSQLFGYFSGKSLSDPAKSLNTGTNEKKRHKNPKNRRLNDDDEDDDEDDEEGVDEAEKEEKNHKKNEEESVEAVVEMCTGWVLIPISATLRSGNKRIKLPMMGGTPFTTVSISESDIALRPGAWAAIQRGFGYKVQSILDVCITPIAPTVSNINKLNHAVGGVSNTISKAIPTATNPSLLNTGPVPVPATTASNPSFNPALQLTRTLPDTIILPSSAVSCVGIFRLLLNHQFLLVGNPESFKEINGDHKMNIYDGIQLGHEPGRIALTDSYQGTLHTYRITHSPLTHSPLTHSPLTHSPLTSILFFRSNPASNRVSAGTW
jgi:hypothetical protein